MLWYVTFATGGHPEDPGHPQGEMCVLFWPASEPSEDRRDPLAAPGPRGVPREGEIRAHAPPG